MTAVGETELFEVEIEEVGSNNVRYIDFLLPGIIAMTILCRCLFFPMEAMPDWLGSIVQFLPLTYFANALRDVMGGGASFMDVSIDLGWMLAWSVVLIITANYTFSFEKKRV